MTTIPKFLDAELAVVNYLRGRNLGTGVTVGTSRPPGTLAGPFVRVNRIGGIPAVKWAVDAPRLQVDTWAATQKLARDTAVAVEAAMYEMPFNVVGVSDVGTDLGLTWQPDDVETPSQPRYIQGFVVYIRPPRV